MLNIYAERIRKSNQLRLVFALLLPTIIMVFTALILAGITYFFGLDEYYWGLPIAVSMLIGNFILIYLLKLNYEELGLKIQKEKLYLHILSFILLVLYSIISLYITGIKNLNGITKQGIYNLFFFTIAAFSDEIYFRGIIYRLLQVWNEKTAFLGSSLIYGYWTIPVGSLPLTLALAIILPLPIPLGPLERILLGLAFCAMRYTSKMILLIIPFHILVYIQNELIVQNNVASGPILISYILLVIVIGIILLIHYIFEKKKIKITEQQN